MGEAPLSPDRDQFGGQKMKTEETLTRDFHSEATEKEMQSIHGILVLYHHPLGKSASTIREHVNALGQYSRFRVWEVNVEYGFPVGLGKLQFNVVVLHYSLFGLWPH